jgi:hypothetical protein
VSIAILASKAPSVVHNIKTARAGNGVSVAGAAGNETTSGIRLVNGRAPINSKYAGGVHPSGVEFTAEGFPNFGPFSKAEVQIKGLTGNVTKDSALANQAMGYPSTPKGFTWHHVEDASTMQLVPSSLHELVRHTGGAAVIRAR